MARVPWNEPGIIMKLLDAGCLGIICPMINTAEDGLPLLGRCVMPLMDIAALGQPEPLWCMVQIIIIRQMKH